MSYDYALIQPDGSVSFGVFGSAHPLDALGAFIPDVTTQGAGQFRMWFADVFTADMDPNPYADAILGALCYRHRDGWRGPVGLTLEESPHTGRIPQMTPDTVMAISAATRDAGGSIWTPASVLAEAGEA